MTFSFSIATTLAASGAIGGVVRSAKIESETYLFVCEVCRSVAFVSCVRNCTMEATTNANPTSTGATFLKKGLPADPPPAAAAAAAATGCGFALGQLVPIVTTAEAGVNPAQTFT